jgi:hypothetical protein
MKKEILLVVILAIVIIALVGVMMWPNPTNNNPQPVTSGIQIILPKANEEISSPLKITGLVNGNGWAGFEGQVGTVKLLDNTGKELSLGILTATTEWTVLPTSFETILNFQSDKAQTGTLVFKNENASGLPEKDKTFVLPVKISKNENIAVNVFFGNLALSSSGQIDECKRVYYIRRYIDKTQAVAEATINELLNGPTDQEKAQGYFTSIPANSKLNSISIVDGEARVDFNEIIESGGGSCSMASRVAQIRETLMQFLTITSIKLSINGRTGDIFQP